MYKQAAIQQLYAFWNTESNNNQYLIGRLAVPNKFQTKLKDKQLLYFYYLVPSQISSTCSNLTDHHQGDFY